MQEERLENVCARLCLLSSLNRMPDDPQPLTRRAVQPLIESGLLDGLVLRENGNCTQELLVRARRLLARASSVYEGILRYHEKGYRIILPEDRGWPQRLVCLGHAMPQYLFLRGNAELLEHKTIAVAGSRDILKETRRAAEMVGSLAAADGLTLVCGAARGVDQAALYAALENGGCAIVVPAVPVYEMLKEKILREALDAGRLLILCETPPDEAFSASKALARNHTIYALGEFAMVIASRKQKGGSYSGARDCLRGKWTPVCVIEEQGSDYEGNALLRDLGAYGISLAEIENSSGSFREKVDAHFGEESRECQISLFQAMERDA